MTELHGANNLNKQTALTEKGEVVNGRGDTPNMHDILTGSQPDGTAIAGNVDTTCGNWTKSGEGAAMVGHSDRTGLDESVPAKSWNSSHQSRGCSYDALKVDRRRRAHLLLRRQLTPPCRSSAASPSTTMATSGGSRGCA